MHLDRSYHGFALAAVLIGLLALPVSARAVSSINDAEASPDGARATALTIGDDLIVVGRSEATTSSGAKVTVLSVAGEDVLARESDESMPNGRWTGHAAAAGAAIDAYEALDLHSHTCSTSPVIYCVFLPRMSATHDENDEQSVSLAQFTGASLVLVGPGIVVEAELLRSSALTQKRKTSSTCFNRSHSQTLRLGDQRDPDPPSTPLESAAYEGPC